MWPKLWHIDIPLCIYYTGDFSSIFSQKSKVSTSELLGNPKKLFPVYQTIN